MNRHITVLLGLLVLSSLFGEQHAQDSCGSCIDMICMQAPDSERAKQLMKEPKTLFYGKLVGMDLLTSCEDRAVLTFKVIRRWKGADESLVFIRTEPCTNFDGYPFRLGHAYFIAAVAEYGTKAIMLCHPPFEGPAAQSFMAELDKIRDTNMTP
jgi:hypothetical protein